MRPDEIAFQITGKAEENQHVSLDDFIKQLSFFLQALQQTDTHLSKADFSSTYYQVVDLRHSSPAYVAIRAVPVQNAADQSSAILSTFFNEFSAIEKTKQVAPNIERPLLESFRNVILPLGKQKVSEFTVFYQDQSLELSASTMHYIDAILAEEEMEEEGSISGMLEEINIHAGTNSFRIYPKIGPSKVICHFPRQLMEQAINSVNRHVNVYGKLKYKARERFPFEVVVSDIEVYPSDEELPTLDDLRGIAPNATQGVSSEEFVRNIRVEWK